jgi:hypothetical protein
MSDERPPIEELSLADLREDYKNLTEAWLSNRLSESERERRAKMWTALQRRTDVDQPACPNCGARNWGFSDHIECRACDYATAYEEDDLRAEIQTAWNRILGDTTAEGSDE